jgi:hypothetical protein
MLPFLLIFHVFKTINVSFNMKIKLILLGCILSVTSLGVFAQQQFANTLTFNEKEGSPKATIEEASWIAGYWRGSAMGGEAEEIWSEPNGGTMMCTFKFVQNGEIIFYELETISEKDQSLLLQIKHFNADLTGWEEKDESVDFRLVKITQDKIFFDGLTFERIGENEMNVYVVIEEKGSSEEVKFNYKK